MGNILTQDAISTAKQYPPMRENARINEMTRWFNRSQRYFNGMFSDEVGAADLERQFQLSNYGSSKRLSPNWYRFMMRFWQSAIMADEPVVSYDNNNRVSDYIEQLMPSLNCALSEIVADIIRYGCGVAINRTPLMVEAVDPRFWFPVRAAHDINEGDVDIIAYPFSNEKENDSNANRLSVYYFSPSMARHVIYKLEGNSIGNSVSNMEMPPSAIPVVSVSNDNTLYGKSDFCDADVYITELFRRESIVSVALDKQASPHLSVPEGILAVNNDGSYDLDTSGMVLPQPKDQGQPPSYISWAPTFEGQTEAIKRAEARIYQLTGISQILIEPQVRSAALTGAALRRLAAPTVSKIRMIRGKLDMVIKQVIQGQFSLLSSTGGENIIINPDDIQIVWRPELSGGLSDESDALATLIGAGVISQELGVQIATGLNARQASEQIENDNNNNENNEGENNEEGEN